MDRFDRIYDLHKLLSSSRYPVSREKIEQELECSRATAKRIIDSMRLYLDAPIKYDRSLNGYYYDRKQESLYELPGLWFNASELHALLSVQQLLASLHPAEIGDLIQSLPHGPREAGDHQVTVGRETYRLPELFLVMATQNPIEQEGTYPLPEAQLDRFLLQIDVSYPDADAERRMLFATTGTEDQDIGLVKQSVRQGCRDIAQVGD